MSFTTACVAVLDGIYKLKDESGRPQWEVFHDMPSAQLTHYYAVMRRPISLTVIRKALRKNQYRSVQEFVRDVAQIAQNAKAYNDPSTIYWQDGDAIEKYLKQELPKLREAAVASGGSGVEVRFPNLEPVLKYEDEDDDSSDGPSSSALSRSRRRRSARQKSMSDPLETGTPPPVVSTLKRDRDDGEEELEGRRKRGRPPTVDKPHEHRIKAILRAVRRVKDESGRNLSSMFEKVPDQRLYPDYHQLIERPLALDSVRKNIKRRQYRTVDDFLNDMNLLFANAKTYFKPETQMHQDALLLEMVMNQTADEEKKKPDSAYADPDSNSKVARLPLDSVEHRGELYTVGDWVHISNPNDPAKPTVGQIFRLWRENGKTWANCCWYYRPEQTVHKWYKLFWENEVVKSGQYRDHLVDDILEKCFVMFITKYQRGRPKDIGNRSVYLCESRYNENEKTFNKIRTWKACIPDEIRNTDYPMDMYDKTKPIKKLYSPLRNELPADARDDDPIPEPTMGDNMAPPLRGAVYKRPYDPNDPPEEPTPPSPNLPDSTPNAPSRSMSNLGQSLSGNSPMGAANQGAAMGQGGSQGYNRGPAINNKVFRSSQPPLPPPIIPTAYILPEQYTNTLDEAGLADVSKLPQGQPLWFSSCPVSITHRIFADPLPPSLRFDVDGETRRGVTPAHGFGHSARYLAWRRKQQAA